MRPANEIRAMLEELKIDEGRLGPGGISQTTFTRYKTIEIIRNILAEIPALLDALDEARRQYEFADNEAQNQRLRALNAEMEISHREHLHDEVRKDRDILAEQLAKR